MSNLSLHLFGPPKLDINGILVHIPRRKATALLAYLTVSTQSHTREALATLLWPQNNQSAARAELRRTLSVLNRMLGEGWLQADREIVSWIPDPGNALWLDVTDFQDKLKVSESHDHPANTACPECTPILEAAVELYTDDFMTGFNLSDCREYEDWQFFNREELRSQLANALMRLCFFHESARDYETAIRYAQRWLVLDPLQETAHQQLISLFSQSGQRSTALQQYENCQQILMDELGVEPTEKTQELYQRINTSSLVSVAKLRPRNNLPIQTTPFIGRESELAEIRAKLKQEGCRLLTLLGPGGSGKTWLAIEAARGLVDVFKHGAFFVNLAPLELSESIPTTIAAVLSFSFYEEGKPEEQLLDYLENKELLLILDNFEHILTGVTLVNKILNKAPGVTILATSRTSLNVSGEHTFDVWGMLYPESSEVAKTTIDQYSAVKLFDYAAKRKKANFELTSENIPDVIRICSLVEGMPLGIVLAASWANILYPQEIATEIARDLSFLEKELQDLPLRQRGMRSVFNHSWRLLSNREQRILSALSVFRGGFTREAAQCVTGSTINDLMGLSEKSILHRVANKRYEVHELLRQFAEEKLSESREHSLYRDRHFDYYKQLGEQAKKALISQNQNIWVVQLELELNNFRCALSWAEINNPEAGLCLVNSLWRFWAYGYMKEGEAWLSKLLSKSIQIEPVIKAEALCKQSFFNLNLYNRILAQELVEHGLILYRELGNRDGIAFGLSILSNLTNNKNDAKQILLESLELYRATNNTLGIAEILVNLGYHEGTQNHFQSSLDYLEESLSLSRKMGHLVGIATNLNILGLIALWKGDLNDARLLLEESLRLHGILDFKNSSMTLSTLAEVYCRLEAYEQACVFFEKSITISQIVGNKVRHLWASARKGYLFLRVGKIEEARTTFINCQQQFLEVGGLSGVVYSTEGLARLLVSQRQVKKATQLIAWADATRRVIQDPRPPIEQVDLDRDTVTIIETIGEKAYTLAYTEGQTLKMEEAIKLTQNI